jgi:hypothetical protein
MSEKYREIATIAGLLLVTAIFGFVLIPIGIREGFGSDGAGLSPRFMPELATIGIAAALIFGLVKQLLVAESSNAAASISEDDGSDPMRAVIVIAICLFFALIGFRVAGFYLGGLVMASSLTAFLGERKLLKVVVFPILVLLVIYIVFEFGFQIRLPKSGLISSIPV